MSHVQSVVASIVLSEIVSSCFSGGFAVSAVGYFVSAKSLLLGYASCCGRDITSTETKQIPAEISCQRPGVAAPVEPLHPANSCGYSDTRNTDKIST